MIQLRNKKQTCKGCGCTDFDTRQCVAAQGYPCYWIKKNLCSRCDKEGKGTKKVIHDSIIIDSTLEKIDKAERGA